MILGTAPASFSAACTAATDAPTTPSATRIATLRVRTPPSPGRCVNDRAGDACYFRRRG